MPSFRHLEQVVCTFNTSTSVPSARLKFVSEEIAQLVMTLKVISPSTNLSATPVTVTACAVSQFPGVNVRADVDILPSPVSALVVLMVTLAEGVDSNTTSNEAVPPDSEVRRGCSTKVTDTVAESPATQF
jgi:hypothetical protein